MTNTIYRGDTSKITITLKETSDVTDFNGYTVLLTLKQYLDKDNTDGQAVIKKSEEVTTPSTDEIEFDLSHEDTLIPNVVYNANIRLVKNSTQEVISSDNFNITFTLGTTQRVE